MRLRIGWMVFFLAAQAPLPAADSTSGSAFRFAMSESLVPKNVTPAEARQAMNTWATEIKRQVPNFVVFEISIHPSVELLKRVRTGELDGVVVSAFEYPSVAPFTDGSVMINEATPDGEEYLLMVHKESNINSLADLKGRRVMVYDHPKMNVARVWLDTALGNARLPTADLFFSSFAPSPKVNLTVLGVFFKTADACLIAKRSFATMVEMNPQIGIKLRTLASSPKLVPSVLVFRKDCLPQSRRDFEKALVTLKSAPAGQQALALFDGTGVVKADPSALKPSLDMIAAHDRLRPHAGSSGK